MPREDRYTLNLYNLGSPRELTSNRLRGLDYYLGAKKTPKLTTNGLLHTINIQRLDYRLELGCVLDLSCLRYHTKNLTP